MTKNLAFVSTAHIHFKGFANFIAESGGAARIAAIWDDDTERGARNAARYQTALVPALADLTARPDIDGFVVCAPNNQRLDLLNQLAPTGKPVMCEKPLALTAPEARDIKALVAAHGMVLTTGFFRQSYGVYRAIAGLIQDGALGNITHARFCNAHDGAYRRYFDDPDVAWMADPAIAGGGATLDMGAHALHLLAWLFGPAEQVWATIANHSGLYPDVDDHGTIHLRFPGGMQATAEAGWINIDGPGELAVFGDAASLHAADAYDKVEGHILGADRQSRPLTGPPSGPRTVDRLLAAIQGKIPAQELEQELNAAANAAAMMDAAYKSAATGTWQPIEQI